MQIRNHHRRAIDRLANAYRDDSRFRALIIGGSVAKGCARDDSDVDFLIIATDEAFDRHRTALDLFINRRDLCDYDGGFVDGKIINLAFLSDLAEKGNEPSRAAFEGAFVPTRIFLTSMTCCNASLSIPRPGTMSASEPSTAWRSCNTGSSTRPNATATATR